MIYSHDAIVMRLFLQSTRDDGKLEINIQTGSDGALATGWRRSKTVIPMKWRCLYVCVECHECVYVD